MAAKIAGMVGSGDRVPLARSRDRTEELEKWVPKTKLGKMAKNGEINSLDEIFERNMKIMEPEIVDFIVPDLGEEMVAFKKTTRVRRAGRVFGFRVSVMVGDKNQHVGLGTASDREKWPAVRKATKKAKLSLIRIRRGCGSWECTCGMPHSVPFRVEGRSSSVRVALIPAPKGTGLVVGDNIKNVMRFAGITDVWSKTRGNTASKLDFVAAALDALSQTTKMMMSDEIKRKVAKG